MGSHWQKQQGISRGLTAVGVMALLPLLLLAASCTRESTEPSGNGASAEPYAAADAPAESLRPDAVKLQIGDGGDLARLVEERRGKVVLVDFWATWCGPCTEQFPHTVALAREHADRGLAVIAVSIDEPEEEAQVRQFLASQGATFDNLLSRFGSDDETFDVFDIPNGAVPHYKLFDRQGRLVRTFASGDPLGRPFTADDIDQAVLALLATSDGEDAGGD